MAKEFRILLRDGVVCRAFPKTVGVYHSDTGDTLIMDRRCGDIVLMLANVNSGLLPSDIANASQASWYGGAPLTSNELEGFIAVLESSDLIRIMDSD